MAEAKIMDQEAVGRAILRMAHEILEKNKEAGNLALVGIHTRGVILAQRLKTAIKQISGMDIPSGVRSGQDRAAVGIHRFALGDSRCRPAGRESQGRIARRGHGLQRRDVGRVRNCYPR